VLARKFDVGQSVYLRPNLSTRNAAFGVYEIRATLPAEDGQFRYQESIRVARARCKRERVEHGVTP
jgi:hypothetical protein